MIRVVLRIHLEADAGLFHPGPGHGHQRVGAGTAFLRKHVQVVGAEGGGRHARAGGTVACDVATQLHFVALGAEPAGLRTQRPVLAVLVGHFEQRGRDADGLVTALALQQRCALGGRFLALLVQGHDGEVVQDVVHADLVAAVGRSLVTVAQRCPAAEQRGQPQAAAEHGAPVQAGRRRVHVQRHARPRCGSASARARRSTGARWQAPRPGPPHPVAPGPAGRPP
ncbi:hypothetical protein G6F32_014058 [Rhizopus arrhizus]|nr:hypothetical protein G6F32_014058 [Rhizopus arrhizus]